MADLTLEQFRNSPVYKRHTPEEQQAAEKGLVSSADVGQPTLSPLADTQKAWDTVYRSQAYQSADKKTAERIKAKFDIQNPLGPQVRVEEENRYNSLSKNLVDNVKESFGMTYDAVGLSKDVASRNVGEDTAGNIARSNERNKLNYSSPEEQKTQRLIQTIGDKYEKAEGLGAVKEALLFPGRVAKEILTNYEGALLTGASSLGFMVPGILGMVGGAKTGALATAAIPAPGARVAGVVGGGFIGSFMGQVSPEAGAKFQEVILGEAARRGVEPTEANLQVILDDKQFVNTAFDKSTRKALVTAATGAALDVLTGKIGSSTLRLARKTAKNTLLKAGKSATKEAIELEASAIMKTKGLASKLDKVKAGAFDIGAEGASEAAGGYAAEGKLDLGEVAGEIIGAVGMGAAIKTPATIKAFGDKAIAKTGTALSKAATDAHYKETVKTAVKDKDPSVLLDSSNEKFNPLAGATAAQELNNDKDTTPEDSVKNFNAVNATVAEIDDRMDVIVAQKQIIIAKGKRGETLTQEEITKKDVLTNEYLELNNIQSEMLAKVTSMGVAGTTDQDLKKANRKVLGSKADNDNLVAAQAKATESQKALTEQVSDPKHQEVSKATGEVHVDVMQGGKGKKGIKQYERDMLKSLESDNIPQATNELNNLTSFAETHSLRAKTFRAIAQSFVLKKPASKADAKQMRVYNDARNALGKDDYSVNTNAFERVIATMELEATALNDAVAAGKELLNVYSAKETSPDKVAGKPVDTVETVDTGKSVSPTPAAIKAYKIRIAGAINLKGLKNSLAKQVKIDPKDFRVKVLTDRISELEKPIIEKAETKEKEVVTKPKKKAEVKPFIPYKGYKGLPVRLVDNIPTQGKRTIPVIMRNTGKEILYNTKLLSSKFKSKAWTKSPILEDGSRATALPTNIFKTEEALLKFMLQHEEAHNHIKQNKGETAGRYEDRINNSVLDIKPTFVPLNQNMNTDDTGKSVELTPEAEAELRKKIAGVYTPESKSNRMGKTKSKDVVTKEEKAEAKSVAKRVSDRMPDGESVRFEAKQSDGQFLYTLTGGYWATLRNPNDPKSSRETTLSLDDNKVGTLNRAVVDAKIRYEAETTSVSSPEVVTPESKQSPSHSPSEAGQKDGDALVNDEFKASVSNKTIKQLRKLYTRHNPTTLEGKAKRGYIEQLAKEKTKLAEAEKVTTATEKVTTTEYDNLVQEDMPAYEEDDLGNYDYAAAMEESLGNHDYAAAMEESFDPNYIAPIAPIEFELNEVTSENDTNVDLVTPTELELNLPENPTEGDLRSVHVFKAFFKVGKKREVDLINKSKNILADILKAKDKVDNDADRSVLDSLHNFIGKSNEKLLTLLPNKKRSDYFYSSPVYNLTQVFGTAFDKKKNEYNLLNLPQGVRTAISAVSYKFLTGKGQNTILNDDRAIKGILELKKNDPDILTKSAYDVLQLVGSQTELLIPSLGQEIFALLNVEEKLGTPVHLKQEIELALGQLALGNMEALGYIKRTEIFSSILGDLKNTVMHGTDAGYKFNHISPSFETKYKGTEKEIKVKTEEDRNKKTVIFFAVGAKATQQLKNVNDRNKNVFEELFYGEKDRQNYTYRKIAKPENDYQMPLHKAESGEVASVEQTNNLYKNMNQSIEADLSTMGAYFNVGEDSDQSIERMLEIAGSVDPDTMHKDNRKSAASINRDLRDDLDRTYTWMRQAKGHKNGLAAPFYVRQTMMLSGRMMPLGDVNTQGSKLQRALFGLTKTKSTFNPRSTVKNYKLNRVFKMAVAQAMGIEVYKTEGGLKGVLKEFDTLMKTDVMKDALASAQVLISKERLTDKQYAALLAGVKLGGENVISFKGIIEYQRFLNAKADKDNKGFTTNITYEIDGSANGPAISLIQFSKIQEGTAAEERLNSMLRAVGFIFDKHENQEDGKPVGSKDPYEALSAIWKNILANMEANLTSEKYTRFHGMTDLVGSLSDKGSKISKALRKLTKDNTVGSLYGTGEDGLLKSILNSAVINSSIKKGIEKLVAAKDLEGLTALRNTINEAAGGVFFLPGKKKLTLDDYLSAEISDKLIAGLSSTLREYHNAALHKAVTIVYADIAAAKTSLNNSIKLATGRYNAALEFKVTQLIESKQKSTRSFEKLSKSEIRAELDKNEIITKEEMDVIYAELDPLLPRLVTAFGNKIPLYQFVNSKSYGYGANKLTQSFNNGDGKRILPLHTRARTHTALGSYGVKGPVTGIHLTDATIMNLFMGQDIPFTNIHDAVIVGIDQAEEAGIAINKIFKKILKEFSLAQNIDDLLDTSTEEFSKFAVANNLTLKKNNNNDNNIFTKVMDEIEQLDNFGENRNNDYIDDRTPQQKYDNLLNKTLKANDDTIVSNNEFKTDFFKDGIEANHYFYPTATETTITIEEATDIITTTELNSSADSQNMSIDPVDYAKQQEINGQNVLETYNLTKNDSNISDNQTHDLHLQRLLKDIVSKVLRPISLHMKVDSTRESEGKFVSEDTGQKIFISSQVPLPGGQQNSGALATGIRMSTGEVYTHEILHAILHTGLGLNRTLYRHLGQLHKIAYDRLDYKAFLNDPTIDVLDPANRFEVEAAQERYDYIFRNPDVAKDGSSTYLDEFIVLGLTNENFMKALSSIMLADTDYRKSSWREIKGANLQEKLVSIGTMIFDFFFKTLNSKNRSTNVTQELEQLAIKLAKVDSQQKTKLFQSIQKFDAVYTKGVNAGNKYIKDSVKSWPVTKVVTGLRGLASAARKSNNPLGQKMRETSHAFSRLEYGVIKSIITEAVGKTPRLELLYQLIGKKKNIFESMKLATINTHKEEAQAVLPGATSKAQKAAVTKVGLRTDMVALLDTFGLTEISKMLKSDDIIQENIKTLLTQIQADPALSQHMNYFDRASSALGYHIVHTMGREGDAVYTSTRVIAALRNTEHKDTLTEEEINRADLLVDQLASLYAMSYTSKDNKAIFSKLLADDPDGINGLLRMHQILKERALKESFGGNKFKFMKGYTAQILNPRIEFKLGTAADADEFIKNGYTQSPNPIKRDEHDPTNKTKVWVFTAPFGRVNSLDSGIASVTNNVARGADSKQIAMMMDQSTKLGQKNNQIIITAKQAVIKGMASNKTPAGESANNMVAQVDDNGDITAYRYMMAETTKDDYLEQVNDFDTILGSMAGQLMDKTNSVTINEELIDTLKIMQDKEYQENPDAYVEIGPLATDPAMREIYYLLPEKAKQYITKRFGTNAMHVAKDVVTLAFGQRQYSLVQAFAKTPAERKMVEKMVVSLMNRIFKDNGIKIVNNVEIGMEILTKIAKDNIVVKMFFLTMNNLGSNMGFLRMQGVPFSMIIRYGYEATVYGLKYQSDQKKVDKLNVRKEVLKKSTKSPANLNKLKDINFEIIKLSDALVRNPTAVTIRAGLMPAVVDDYDTETVASDFPSPFEKAVEKQVEKLPKIVQNIGKVALLTHDTQAYTALNNLVKMTDFIGRHVLYTKLMNDAKKNKTNLKEAHAAAVLEAEEKFVNFNLPTHRVIDYGNRIGLLWFTRYFIRIQKIIANSAIDKPIEALTTFIGSDLLGVDNIVNSNAITSDWGMHLGNAPDAFVDTLDDPLSINILGSLFGK